jgi:DNA-binding FadR family transcriptional regulator
MSRLHRSLLRQLLLEIAIGSFPEGARLPRETDLAERFDVSRGVVRESLRGLEERGVIRVRHGAGATVRPSREWNVLDPDVLSAVLEGQASASLLGEFLECRRIFEIECAGLAAQRASEEDIAAMSAAYERMQESAHPSEFSPTHEARYHEANVQFHQAIMVGARNRVLSRLTEPVQRAFLVARGPTAHRELRLTRTMPEHLAILRAIVDRDPVAAREAMLVHLTSVAGYIERYGEERSSAPERRASSAPG